MSVQRNGRRVGRDTISYWHWHEVYTTVFELSLSLSCTVVGQQLLLGSKDDRSWTVRTSGERLSAFVSVIVKPKQTMTESGSDGLFVSEVQLADYRVNCHSVISTSKLFLDPQTASCCVCWDCEGTWEAVHLAEVKQVSGDINTTHIVKMRNWNFPILNV